MYEISNISKEMHANLIKYLRLFAPEILKIDTNLITRSDFWEKPSEKHTKDKDLRKRIEKVLMRFIKENAPEFIQELVNCDLYQMGTNKYIYTYLPRIIVILPERNIPEGIMSLVETKTSGFLNDYISNHYQIASFFVDLPPHIDLVDYPDGKDNKIYTMLIPLNKDMKEENGGIFLSDLKWNDKEMATDRVKTEVLKKSFRQHDIKIGQKGIWNEHQPHAVTRNKESMPLIMFRVCFSLEKSHIPTLRSEVLEICDNSKQIKYSNSKKPRK